MAPSARIRVVLSLLSPERPSLRYDVNNVENPEFRVRSERVLAPATAASSGLVKGRERGLSACPLLRESVLTNLVSGLLFVRNLKNNNGIWRCREAANNDETGVRGQVACFNGQH